MSDEEELTGRCDSCRREVAIRLLYPFPLYGKFNRTGFRCNVCVDTENRNIAQYGIMRDKINSDVSIRPYFSDDITTNVQKEYLHARKPTYESDEILPVDAGVRGKMNYEGLEAVLALQTEFMTTGKLSDESVLKVMAFFGILLEDMNRTPHKNILKTRLTAIMYEAFHGEEEE